MLSKTAETIPPGPFLYEPKWDGFRAIVFRGGREVFIQSRDLRPLDRYFPELHESLTRLLPAGCVIDGEIVIATPHGLDFDALQLRLHPARSRRAGFLEHRVSSRPAASSYSDVGGWPMPARALRHDNGLFRPIGECHER